MRIRLICMGSKMPSWVDAGFKEYHQRLAFDVKLELVEIPLKRRVKGIDVDKLREQEAEKMLKAIGADDWVVALEISGKNWDTTELSQQLKKWMMNAKNVSLLVGGPEGLWPSCIQRANIKWSLSNLTFPHPIVRILISEQIYRAASLLNNHPYHK